jgi:hypothetical protein
MLLVLLLPQSMVCPPMLTELLPILMKGCPSPVTFPPIEIEGEPFDGTLMLMPGRSIETPLSLVDPRRDALASEQRHRLTMTEVLIVAPGSQQVQPSVSMILAGGPERTSPAPEVQRFHSDEGTPNGPPQEVQE